MGGRDGCGVIWVATGADYRDLAVASARSLRAQEPDLPFDLFTDAPAAAPSGLFHRVHPIVDPQPRSKLLCMAETRFPRTLFLDADTQALGPLDDLFDLLDRFDLAMAHDVRRASRLIREGSVPTPYAFPQLNSGVVLYRRSPAVLAFLAEWRRRFHALGATRDQTVLKDLLWQDDSLRFYVLPPEFNLRRVTELDAWEPLDARPTILHSHRLMDHLRGAPRLSDPLRILEEERRMLVAEWAAAGVEGDAVTRFRLAQRTLGEAGGED
jgi:hypothetical protein